MPSCKTKKHSDRIVINVGGVRHETFLSTLKNIPDTRLYNLGEHHTTVAKSPEYDNSTGEYFFDRHPGVFAHILNFYRTGRLHCPADVCGPLFEEELGFWSIDEQQVETCCWESYKQHKEKQEKLKYFKLPGFDEDLEDSYLSKDSGLFEDVDDTQSWWSRYRPKVWKSLEEPHTSLWAKFVGIVSFLLFAAYLIKFSLATLDYFSDRTSPRYIALSVIHLICLSWFTMDFALRLVFSPDKSAFVKSPFTWTDLIPLVLLYVFFFHPSLDNIPFLEMLVMLKAARIFQLFKLSYVLQVLVNTLKASSCELCLLLGIMAFVMVMFATVLYFIERHEFESDFRSVPESMWWAVITMTTVGYGEVYPRTWIGKTVGSACAICGVLVIALPVSVVASNFSLFYTYAKARLNVPPKKRRVALSHALTSMHNARTQAGDAQSLKFTSLCSERQTDRSIQASEISISCSVTPRESLKKSSFWSLRSFSKLLRPTRESYVNHSRSLNSILSGITPNKEKSIEGITLRLEPPSRSPSAIDIPQYEGSLSTGIDTLLHVPGDKKNGNAKGSIKGPPMLNRSLYPLHLRRGAVSPASFSLKSNSTTSSLNALPRGYNELCNALSGKGPIILLSDQASVQSFCSLQSLNPMMSCSCSSLRGAGTDASGGEGDGTAVNDGNSVSDSPTAKVDVMQATLDVPKGFYGMRKSSKENATSGTEDAACYERLLATDNERRGSETSAGPESQGIMDQNNIANTNNSEVSLTDQEVANEISGNLTLTENAKNPNTPAQSQLSSRCSNGTESNWPRHNVEEESPPHTLRPFEKNTSFKNNNKVAPSEDIATMNSALRPEPLAGRHCMGTAFGDQTLTMDNRAASVDLGNNINENHSDSNSAFTPCRKRSRSPPPRKCNGPLRPAYMRGTPTGCQPLLNGDVARARACDKTADTANTEFDSEGLCCTNSLTTLNHDLDQTLECSTKIHDTNTNRDKQKHFGKHGDICSRATNLLSLKQKPLCSSSVDSVCPRLSAEFDKCLRKERVTHV